ncbi:MAG: exopolyphosphatase [Acidimicrobiia bacterium]
MTVSAIDIGSNSVRLLTVDAQGAEIRKEVEVTALARGVDAAGLLSEAAVVATERTLSKFAALIESDGSDRVGIVATSASRDATNGAEVMARLERILGVAPEIIGGGREASLAFAGATAHMPVGTHVVVDIGGGSTEVIKGSDAIQWAHSYDIGSVRLTDRGQMGHPMPRAGLATARQAADVVLSTPRPEVKSDSIIGVAGTFTSIAAIVLELAEYDRTKVHLAELSLEDIEGTVDRLASMTLSDVAAIPSLDPKRAPAILGGTIVAAATMSALSSTTVTVSEHDLLDGLAAELLTEG